MFLPGYISQSKPTSWIFLHLKRPYFPTLLRKNMEWYVSIMMLCVTISFDRMCSTHIAGSIPPTQFPGIRQTCLTSSQNICSYKPDLKTLRDPSPDPIQSSVPSGSGSVLMLHTREWTRPRILWNGAITNTTSGSASAFSSRYFYPIIYQFFIGKAHKLSYSMFLVVLFRLDRTPKPWWNGFPCNSFESFTN